MKSAVRFVTIIAPVLVILAAATLVAADLHSVQPGDLTVHEWGTFTSVAGEDGSAIDWDALGCQSDLPRFVNDHGYRGFKFRLRGTVRMETPVMYFYSPRELDAHVKVAFPQGLITEWYPQAEYEVFQKGRQDGTMHRLESNLNGLDTSLRSLTGAMEWRNVKVQPGSAPVLPVESDPSRYYAARATDSRSDYGRRSAREIPVLSRRGPFPGSSFGAGLGLRKDHGRKPQPRTSPQCDPFRESGRAHGVSQCGRRRGCRRARITVARWLVVATAP